MVRRQPVRQNDVSFGEVSPDFAAGGDKDVIGASLKRGRNIRLLNSLGWANRPGSRWMATIGSLGRLVQVITSMGDELIGVIYAQTIAIYTENGGLVQIVTGAPWGAAEALELVTEAVVDKLYISHNGFFPQVLTRATDGTWSLADFAFADGAGTSKAQLYYRFAATGILLTPSARTGSITVTFSAPVLEAGHVGTRFRYHGKEILITAVTNETTATATVIDTLPPTYQFSVTAGGGAGFRVGEDVEGATTQAKGIIAAISTDILTVVMTEGFEGFDDSAAPANEYIVGPTTKSRIVAASLAEITPPLGSTVWDEQVLSSVRGYPGIVFQRSARLGFADFPEIPDGFSLSAPGAFEDFDLGEGSAADAVFVRAGNPSGQRIEHVVASNSLLVLTDRRAYYVPENEDTPLAADTISFQEIAPTGASTAFPVAVEDGVIYCERGGNRVMGLLATGEVGGPWRMVDLSEFHSHLINNPVSFAKTVGNAQAPERYVFCLNADGTLAVLKFDKKTPQRLGWVPWDTDGTYRSMLDVRGIVYSLCQRIIGGATTYLLERFDEDSQLDASSLFTESTSFINIVADDGSNLLADDGSQITSGSPVMPHLIGQTVHVIRGTAYLGEYQIISPGVVDGLDVDTGDFETGLHFDVDVVYWSPEPQFDTSPGFRKRHIARAAVKTYETGVFAIGIEGRTPKVRPAYDSGDDMEADPPLRSEVYRKTLSGWSHEPSVQITRPIPSPVSILSIAQEVAS